METAQNIYLFYRHITQIQKLIDQRKKAIMRKYKKRIQEDWYDVDEAGIIMKIREHDKEYESLVQLEKRLYNDF